MNFLYATLTQGGADAFVQAQVSLPQQDGFAVDLREVLVEFAGRINMAAQMSHEFAMTRKTFAAMPDVLQPALVWKKKFMAEFVTSGAYLSSDGIVQLQFASKQHQLVEASAFLQYDSNATGAANVVKVRLGYDFVRINANDRLQIIADSLAS